MNADPRRTLGALGERLAASHLEALGYEILDRNFRTRYGELDIVARRGRVLVFCEVKTRRARSPGPFGPLTSIGKRKQLQLRRMAGHWLHERGGSSGTIDARFDVLGITLEAQGRVLGLDHLEDAF